MKKPSFFVISLLTLVCIVSLTLAQSGYDLFQKGLVKERAEGKLEEAIAIYQQVVQKYKTDRALVAKALVEIGQCYEKLGQGQAQKAYEQVVREYADQLEQAKIASGRLAALSGPVLKPIFTKIRVPTRLPRLTDMALSPDGQQLAYITDGSVWLMPVHGPSDPAIAGVPRRLTGEKHVWSSAHGTCWSRDGKWVSFQAWERLPEGGEEPMIFMASVENGELKRIQPELKNYVSEYFDHILSLSPNGAFLAYTTMKEDQKEKGADRRIYLTPTRGGTVKALTLPPSSQPAFSPDGTKIAYVGLKSMKGGMSEMLVARQIWTTKVESGIPHQIYQVPSLEVVRSPIWSPDNSDLIFLIGPENDDPSQLMVMPIGPDGEAAGSPVKIDLPEKTEAQLPGWGSDNKVGLIFKSPEIIALYTVPAAGGKAVQMTSHEGFMPSWTPDGKRIFFGGFTLKDPPIHVESVPASGGKSTRVPIQSPRKFSIALPMGGISVSPDGKKVIFSGAYLPAEENYPVHIFAVPVEGGDLTEIPTGMPLVCQPGWSPDGKSILFVGMEKVPNKNDRVCSLYTLELEGGKPRKIASTAEKVTDTSGVAWSPDGKSIAYYSEDGQLRLIPANGGPSKVLVDGLKGYLHDAGLSWSPDGRELAYLNGSIYKLNLETGKSEQVPTGLADAHYMQISWSPDGKTIAFSALQGGDPELWLMEDFLSLLKK
jgi:Tol biopolymer transport system component